MSVDCLCVSIEVISSSWIFYAGRPSNCTGMLNTFFFSIFLSMV